MVEIGRCLQSGVHSMDYSSAFTTFLILAAFTLGVVGGDFMRSFYGLLSKINEKKKPKSVQQPQELPTLPATVRQRTFNPRNIFFKCAEAVPKHIAVIMDGNRRYGRLKHADALQGHWAGGQTLVDFIQWCMLDGIEVATVYAFSTENWNRDPSEINTLMSIFAKYAESLTTEASTKNVRVRILSTDFEKLPAKVRTSVIELERATAECTGFLVNICLSYGSRAEIIMACNSAIAEKQQQRRIKLSGQLESLEPTASPIFSEVSDVTAVPMFDDAASLDSSTAATDSYERIEIRPQENKRLRETSPATESVIDNEKFHSSSSSCCGAGGSSSDFSVDSRHLSTNRSSCAQESHSHSLSLDEETLSRHMCTANIPDPDILIRTSGEFRISNFLLWQMAYTEMFFVDKFWPEISHRDLRLVLQQFDDRQRRFGV